MRHNNRRAERATAESTAGQRAEMLGSTRPEESSDGRTETTHKRRHTPVSLLKISFRTGLEHTRDTANTRETTTKEVN